jgi:hypothetical protein
MVKLGPGTGVIVLPAVRALAGICHFEYSGNMDEQDVVKALAALAQPVRLKVFRALVVTGDAGLTPGTMAEGLDIPANTLSFHLKELVLGYLTENCCQGADCGLPAARCC